MKILLSYLLVLSSICQAQNAQIYLADQQRWGLGGSYVHLPADYNATTKTYPVVVFIPGLGEAQGNVTGLLNYGPSKFIADGWRPDFIAISMQTGQWPASSYVDVLMEAIFAKYRIDRSRVYLTGLSMGAQAASVYAAAYPGKITAVVAMHSVRMDENSLSGFALSGSKWWGIEGANDLRQMHLVPPVMNKAFAGSAVYSLITKGDGTNHAGWNRFYDPNAKSKATTSNPVDWLQGEESIYAWLLRQKKGITTPPVEPPIVIPPAKVIGLRIFYKGMEIVIFEDGSTEKK